MGVKIYVENEQLNSHFYFFPSRVLYFLHTSLSQAALNHLQLVQTAAGRLLTTTGRLSHITSVLTPLLWPPVKFRINYKRSFWLCTRHDLAPALISSFHLSTSDPQISAFYLPQQNKKWSPFYCFSPNPLDSSSPLHPICWLPGLF